MRRDLVQLAADSECHGFGTCFLRDTPPFPESVRNPWAVRDSTYWFSSIHQHSLVSIP
jgi:hypothetical protein